MVHGEFYENIPLIKIIVAWGQAVQTPYFILDTGFTGDLQVTPQIARELGLRVTGVAQAKIANGDVINVPIALALASMEGVTSHVNVLISESMPLAGISFLTHFEYEAIVDCNNRTISLKSLV